MIGKLLDGRYKVLEKIGEGGMAVVYKAQDTRTDHIVAVKFLREKFHDNQQIRESFKREALAAKKMSHHNIVNLIDVGEESDDPYIVIEYVHGATLKDLIFDKGKLDVHTAVEVMLRILAALDHAHKNHIIHRDIKSQNVLVGEGHIKVADFGIARMTNTREENDKEKLVLGSVHYFSPERARGEGGSEQSDIYSAGVVFYEMLTGVLPFDGEQVDEIARKHLDEMPKSVRLFSPDVPPAIDRVVMRALNKNPEDRYHSAEEMANALIEARIQSQKRKEDKIEKKSRRNISRHVRHHIIVGVTAAFTILVLFFGGRAIIRRVVNHTTVPYLLGETEENARRLAEKSYLKVKFIYQSSNQKAGTVALQSYDHGYSLKKGETILVTISTGPKEKVVPYLIGLSQVEAEALLRTYGLHMLVEETKMDITPIGTVLSQNPPAEWNLSQGEIVQVTLSGGQMTMPDVQGENRQDAIRLLQLCGLPIEKIRVDEVETKDQTLFEKVEVQSPEAGSVFMPGGEDTEVVLAVYVETKTEFSP
ncbi:MAG TPA: protein kinase [Clostridiales bacterium]|jgi:serine/threonine-protein kinase|nr:protein kinase [Clostridiales bacterium]